MLTQNQSTFRDRKSQHGKPTLENKKPGAAEVGTPLRARKAQSTPQRERIVFEKSHSDDKSQI